ncbi:hypothetical protein [Bacillus mycoides]|uniref:DUF4282 domain-containing protein n=1 Tax=Bacillus mycoides (strain KBAB4) TaxID=315730 RepID=A9VVH3_BACMK|nr:hypothetical protein [Bacillus mycoides]ABY46788.1 hypothetical protein BcerKBAB4_5293 [Bacillus mycoides KBAB4]
MSQKNIVAILRVLSIIFGAIMLFTTFVALGDGDIVGGLTLVFGGVVQFIVLQFMASLLETKKETLDKIIQIEGKLKD